MVEVGRATFLDLWSAKGRMRIRFTARQYVDQVGHALDGVIKVVAFFTDRLCGLGRKGCRCLKERLCSVRGDSSEEKAFETRHIDCATEPRGLGAGEERVVIPIA